MHVGGENFQATFDRFAGGLTSLVYDGVEVIADGGGPRLNVYRALTDNDKWFRAEFERSGLAEPEYAGGVVRRRSPAGSRPSASASSRA